MFHMMGALPEYGKLGAVCIGESRESAARYFRTTVDVLNRAATERSGRPGAESLGLGRRRGAEHAI